MDTVNETQSGTLAFFRELTKYFMDFLETDFHKRKLPRRTIKFRNADNLLIGLNLKKYESFNSQILKLITKGFQSDSPLVLSKGVFKTKLPKNLIDLITLQITKVNQGNLDTCLIAIAGDLERAGTYHLEEFDVALGVSLESASANMYKHLVEPFIASISRPLENLNLGDIDNVTLVEQELTAILVAQIEEKISEILIRVVARDTVDVEKELRDFLALQDVKVILHSFFEDLEVADLFLEAFELERNKSILDKQELYLYFGDISFRGNRYPIFYIPISLERVDDSYRIIFDSQIFTNKKALEFIVQENNASQGTRGKLKTISERIIYISQHKEDLSTELNSIANELQNHFETQGDLDFASGVAKIAKGAQVQLTNSCYISLFDKSDEALVNDYEEILEELSLEGGDLSDAFHTILEDFLQKNPEPVGPTIEDEWDETDTPSRLVVPSPIPLNSEQIQILAAIRHDKCKYMVVEGPPGTGKSHTITAIIFDAVLRQKSVLVLSDKKEALDVVEKNITETMNKVRHDNNFQNPILRLGKTGNTYNQILSKASIGDIKAHHRAVKKDFDNIEDYVTKSSNSLKEDIEAESLAYEEIDIREIEELVELERRIRPQDFIFDLSESLNKEDAAEDLANLKDSIEMLGRVYRDPTTKKVLGIFNASLNELKDAEAFSELSSYLSLTMRNLSRIEANPQLDLSSLEIFSAIEQKNLLDLRQYVYEYSRATRGLFGSLFSKRKILDIDQRFRQAFSLNSTTTGIDPVNLIKALEVLEFVDKRCELFPESHTFKFDAFELYRSLIGDEPLVETIREMDLSLQDWSDFAQMNRDYKVSMSKLGLDSGGIVALLDNKLLNTPELVFNDQIRYLELRKRITKEFSRIPDLNYALKKKDIEQLVITQVAYLLDGRVISFYENSKNDAEMLRSVIKSKQKFPKAQFFKLQEAFPCILAGIRDYAEFIPLQHEMFDLVIIDEASQVSLAQAFPALLRAKKVLILGDKKQFSNIKAAQARSDTNREYLTGLEKSFKQNVSRESAQLTRLAKFNIKTSVLDFFEFISNYNTQLMKHFRGYKELIYDSNKNFYENPLQVMKIRGTSIDDVIKFSFVEPSSKDRVYPNSNLKEVEFIINELLRLKAEKISVTVGIITPHTEQQRLLVERISQLPEREYFFDDLKVKIMTFDTCQGEERDIIYYSMVASPLSDRLSGVFLKDLTSIDLEDDGQIRAQRLNVGFSRAKECVHFVLSKPLIDYSGSIGEAIRHYSNVLNDSRQEKTVSAVDARSKMEPEVLNWFYQTEFWQNNRDSCTFEPQFELGKYLKQLDPSYDHPQYRVDFLLVVRKGASKEQKIIIEYDGFYEHFTDPSAVNKYNYQDYYSDDDIYREKVLVSYGYKFLRINKFNSGDQPVQTLDERLNYLLREEPTFNPLMHQIQKNYEDLQSGDMKECPKCKEVRALDEFRDKSLVTGLGRFCIVCKRQGSSSNSLELANSQIGRKPYATCPKCNSGMVLRKGRNGNKFYGCTRYPGCKGVKGYKAR